MTWDFFVFFFLKGSFGLGLCLGFFYFIRVGSVGSDVKPNSTEPNHQRPVFSTREPNGPFFAADRAGSVGQKKFWTALRKSR